MVTATTKLRHLLLGMKAITNLDSVLKSRDITLLTNFHIVKAMAFLRWSIPDGTVVKNLPASAGDTRDAGSIPGLGRSPAKEIATYSSVPAVINPWTEEPGGLQSMGSQRVGYD